MQFTRWLSHNSKQPGLLKAAVYGANDGIITTFAVVAGVAGANLSPNVVLILGIGNLIADGFSMGIGDYLGERSEAKAANHAGRKVKTQPLWTTGLVTFLAFVTAGALPLVPYLGQFFGLELANYNHFLSSIGSTGMALFLVGSLRTAVTGGRWWRNGLEVLGIGAIAAVVAFGLGAWVEKVVN